MWFDRAAHRRQSIRLKGYDYRTPGSYVVTICVQHRACLLGEIVDGVMHESPAGAMVRAVWDELPWAYPGVEIDAFVVMPNHVHGIVCLLPGENHPGEMDESGPGSGGQGQAQGPAPTGGGVRSVGATPRGCPGPNTTRPGTVDRSHRSSSTLGASADSAARLSLPDVVHHFKSLTTYRYGEGVRIWDWPPYEGRLW